MSLSFRSAVGAHKFRTYLPTFKRVILAHCICSSRVLLQSKPRKFRKKGKPPMVELRGLIWICKKKYKLYINPLSYYSTYILTDLLDKNT